MDFGEKIAYYHQQIDLLAETILRQMKEVGSDWNMPWHKGILQAQNPFTGKYYSGNNLLLLWSKYLENKYPYNQWATFYQWRKAKATIKKGEKGTLICIAIPKLKKHRQLIQTNIFEPIDHQKINQQDIYFKFIFRYVFNVAQVNGFYGNEPGLFDNPVDPEKQISKLIAKSGAKISIGGERAYYNIITDQIHIPELARYIDEFHYPALEKYYSTLLHEIIHWTGHESRCKRNLMNVFGSSTYAFEELVAELGCAILSTQLNKRVFPREDHSIYLNNWINVLEKDFSYFIEALELARYSIFWLLKKTNVFPEPLKEQIERKVNKERILEWSELSNLQI
jgi:antirestriction protein ArdC